MNKLAPLFFIFIFSFVIIGCSAVDDNTEANNNIMTPTQLAIPTETPALTATPRPSATFMPTETAVPTAVFPHIDINEVIEYEMEGSFNFFWEQANTDPESPGFGLIRDRYPGSPEIASIASVGFGLTAYLIGIEKGYISYDEGFARVSGTLDTLLNLERTEGFYYHFVNIENGARAWQSEVSTIDTGILLMGVLSVSDYFGDEIQTKAQQIYDDVNWPWFVDESRAMFYMAYQPEKGFEGHWDFYAEQLMLYVLAAGSNTYPLDDTTYYGFIRHYGKYGAGEGFVHSWFGSIFTYQFSHAWLDFRDYTDKEGVNWFDNSVAASLAQYDFAVDKENQYNTLGPEAWGLTASDGPHGYNGLYGAPPSGYDNASHLVDDTVPPSGAIGSIIFTPEEAQAAMLNYYAIEQLKGEYGFLDAYNLSEDWYATDVIGINKGITLLMLANFENDLVHQITMQNEQILQGLSRLQLVKDAAPTPENSTERVRDRNEFLSRYQAAAVVLRQSEGTQRLK